VRLFAERARAVRLDFSLTEENALAVAHICYRLDGIPLALELAAARAKVLSVDQTSERLDNSFSLLTGGGRTAIPHHKTLRAAMDWSYDLLTGQEQTLLARLSVFAGGFALEAAEAVGTGGSIDEYDVLDLLASW
jgi:predicted ATPase